MLPSRLNQHQGRRYSEVSSALSPSNILEPRLTTRATRAITRTFSAMGEDISTSSAPSSKLRALPCSEPAHIKHKVYGKHARQAEDNNTPLPDKPDEADGGNSTQSDLVASSSTNDDSEQHAPSPPISTNGDVLEDDDEWLQRSRGYSSSAEAPRIIQTPTPSAQQEPGAMRRGRHRSRSLDEFINDSDASLFYGRFDPEFMDQLAHMNLMEVQVYRIYQMEAFTARLFCQVTEGELEEYCEFNKACILRAREFRAQMKEKADRAARPIPPAIFNAIPHFRGKSDKSISDPTMFINRFETVMQSLDIDTDRWLRILLMSLTQPEDSAYWSNFIAGQSNRTWTTDRVHFLTHFDQYDQRLKYQQKFHHLQQRPTESCQSYFDRSAELIRMAHLLFEDPLVLSVVRRGIAHPKLKEYLTIREDTEHPYTFAQLTSYSLMMEDRIATPKPREPSFNKTNDDNSVPSSNKVLTCSYCNRRGHIKADCRRYASSLSRVRDKQPAGGSAVIHKPPNLRCNKCQGEHHYSNCPSVRCRTCDKTGHLNFNCPTSTCVLCKVKGHTEQSFLCPNHKRQSKCVTDCFIEDEGVMFEVAKLAYACELRVGLRDETEYLKPLTTAFTRCATEDLLSTPSHVVTAPVTIAGHQLVAILDTGSQVSILNERLADKLGISGQLLHADTLQLKSIFTNLPPVTFKLSAPLHLACGQQSMEHQFFIGPSDVDLLLGMDVFSSLGMGIMGIPTDYSPKSSKPSIIESLITTPVQDISSGDSKKGVFSDLKQISLEDMRVLMLGIDISLTRNELIGEDEFCNRPEAELAIDVGDAEPTWRSQYDIPQKLHSVVDQQIIEWLANKKIEPASPLTRWNTSLLLAPKKDLYGNKSDWRTCFDARPINTFLKSNTYGIPKIKELFRRVSGFYYCSAVDLVGAFHQLPVRPQDRHITTFSWKENRYQFAGAPFGLKHVPGHFQRLMTSVLTAHLQYVLIYIDDVFIFSRSLNEHVLHVSQVIDALTEANLRVRRAKCHFGYREAALLGHIIDGSSIRADPMKVSTFLKLRPPTTGKQVQALLGFIGYLRDYIPCFSKIAKPLEAIKNLKQLGHNWGPVEQKAFDNLKTVLSSSPILSNPDFNQPFLVATDSSQFGNGAVLYQVIDGETKYISFFSKSLNKGQVNYPATKRELLAIVQAIKAFRYYLYGRRFEIFTDHKAIVFMVIAKEPSYMLMNWFEELQEYDFIVTHRPGIEMILPDALSRLYLSIKERPETNEGDKLIAAVRTTATSTPISSSYKVIICPKCQHRPKKVSLKCENQLCLDHCMGCKIHPSSTALITSTPVNVSQPILLDDADPNTVTSHMQEFIKNVAKKQDPGTKALQLEEVEKAHIFNHLGSSNLFKYLFNNGFYWSKMKEMCVQIASTCQQCLQHNVVRKGFHPLRAIHADLPWDHLAIDLGEIRVTSANGSNFFIVIADICTRFLIVRSLPNKAAVTIARTLFNVFVDFGVPKIIQSDNGSEFVNEVVEKLKTECGFQHRTISPYYPQSNGAAESSVKLVKTLLKKHTNGDLSEWCMFIPAVQFALNTRISARHHSTPFSLMFTRPHNLFTDHRSTISQPLTEDQLIERNGILQRLLYPAIASTSRGTAEIVSQDFNLNHHTLQNSLPEGAMVMKVVDVRTSGMNPRYEGPFKVLSRTPKNTYVLLDNTGALHPKNVPLSKLKLISVPEIFLEDVEHYEVERVLKHKGPTNDRTYWVKWKGYPDSENTWVPAADFDAPLIIQQYWSALKTKGKRPRPL